MITEKILNEQLIKLAEYIKVPITKQTLALYREKLDKFTDERFVDVIKYLYINWKYNHFPLIGDFYEAHKATRPTENTFNPTPRDDKAFNPMVQVGFICAGLKCQDIVKKQLLKPIFGIDYDSGYDYKEKRDMFKEFLLNKIKQNECFSLQQENWIKRENAVVSGNYYYYPEKFGW